MGEFKKERKMKVYEATSVSRGQFWTSTKYTAVPQIRLQGKWLEQLGFKSGNEIIIECELGKLVILSKKK